MRVIFCRSKTSLPLGFHIQQKVWLRLLSQTFIYILRCFPLILSAHVRLAGISRSGHFAIDRVRAGTRRLDTFPTKYSFKDIFFQNMKSEYLHTPCSKLPLFRRFPFEQIRYSKSSSKLKSWLCLSRWRRQPLYLLTCTNDYPSRLA